MSVIVNKPLESEYGFVSPSFTVDFDGNITARSITLEVVEEDPELVEVAADIDVSEVSGNFRINDGLINNPGITLYRNSSKTIDLTLDTLTFNIFSSIDGTPVFYNNGIRHSDGTTGVDSQGNNDGRLYFALPASAPDILYYGNADASVYGIITVLDPSGLFGDVNITGTTASTSTTSGALVVAGGVGIAEDLYIGGELNVAGVGIPKLTSFTNLELEAANKIMLRIDDMPLGELNSSGLAVTINNSTIDNTVIGGSTPAAGSFTSATVEGSPTVDNSVTNKQYVDSQALSLAIAFGI